MTHELYEAPELLFNPHGKYSKCKSLPTLLLQSIENVDLNFRSKACQNILLTGGSSIIKGLTERLEKEMNEMISTNFKNKPKLQFYQTNDCKDDVWLGANALALSGSMEHLWITADEYDEWGPSKQCS